MKCIKCTGRMWVEIDRIDKRHYDVVCVNCGKRVMVDTSNDPFGELLRRVVLAKSQTVYFLYDRPHINRRTVLARRGEEWRIVREQDFHYG